MWLCVNVWRASPELQSQILLGDVSEPSLTKTGTRPRPGRVLGGIVGAETSTHAVKSALPVTARDVSKLIFDDHTAPLWPATSELP